MRELIRRPHGRARLLRLPAGDQSRPLAGGWKGNLVLYDWATITARLLRGESAYKLGALYIEFANVASPGDPVSEPTYDRGSPAAYYAGLSSDPAKDYLRVPLYATGLESSDESLFPGGNLLRIYARTSGVVGVHGKGFSSGDNSTVFGAALVATPEFADAEQDLVFSRWYAEESEQRLKEANGQIAVEWELTLE